MLRLHASFDYPPPQLAKIVTAFASDRASTWAALPLGPVRYAVVCAEVHTVSAVGLSPRHQSMRLTLCHSGTARLMMLSRHST